MEANKDIQSIQDEVKEREAKILNALVKTSV